jgi:hypothetical protein
MGSPGRKRGERNAGAFMGSDGFGMIAVPTGTLSDEYHDEPAEPEDSDRVPEPEPPSPIKRIVKRSQPARPAPADRGLGQPPSGPEPDFGQMSLGDPLGL